MLDELSAFLLAYNEEDNIRKSVSDTIKTLSKVANKYELLIVLYEGATDNTIPIAKELAKKNKNIKLIYQKKEDKGYGIALRLGIKNSRYKYIFYMDADNQFDIKDIRKLIPYTKKYDIVSGYRKNRRDNLARIITAEGYNWLLRILFLFWIKDVDSAFKIYNKSIFNKIKLNYKTGIVDAEIIIKAKRNGFKIKEVPVRHFPRTAGAEIFAQSSGFVRSSVILSLLKDMFSLFIQLNISNKK